VGNKYIKFGQWRIIYQLSFSNNNEGGSRYDSLYLLLYK